MSPSSSLPAHDYDPRCRTAAASSTYFRGLLDTIPGLVACLDREWNLQFINRALGEYVGEPVEALAERHCKGIIHPDEEQYVFSQIADKVQIGEDFRMEARCRRSDGTFRWFDIRVQALRDTHGDLTHWCLHMIDIEERKRTEHTLEESEQALRLAIDTMPVLAWAADVSGGAEFLNQNFLDYAGLLSEQATGWQWTTTVHPDDLPRLANYWKTAVASGRPAEHEARLRRWDGEYRHFLFRATPLRDVDGSILRWFGTNTDIHDRKIAEEESRRSMAALTEAQHLSRIGSFTWDVATGTFHWTDQLYAIYALPRDVVVTFDLLASFLQTDDMRLLDEMRAKGEIGSELIEFEHAIVLRDGSSRFVHWIAHPNIGVQGCLEYLGAVQDVTQRKLSEEALRRARNELGNASRNASFDVLTASIAHEVNQPLSGIVTNASTCLRMLDGMLPNIDGARETARRTLRDGKRAAEVIARLRSLFSQKKLDYASLDLNEVAEEVLGLFLVDQQKTGLRLVTRFCKPLPCILGDRVQLQQVILNLLRNAADALVGAQPPRRAIEMTTSATDLSVTLAIRDEGIGFAPDLKESLFEAFNTTKPGGMGIGLSVSRSIIEAHSGVITANPNEGPGSTFQFSIPYRSETG